MVVTLFAEAVVLLFFVLLAIYGVQVLVVLARRAHDHACRKYPTQLTQSAIPIGAALFIIAELLRLPDVLRAARSTGFVDLEIKEASLGEPEGHAKPAGGLQ